MSVFFDSFITYKANLQFGVYTVLPVTNEHYVLLTTASSVDRLNDTMATIITKELVPSANPGYSRFNVGSQLSTGFVYNTSTQNATLAVTVGLTPTSTAIAFQTAVLIGNGDATSSQTVGSVNTGTGVVTLNAHGYSNGQNLVFFANSGGSLPGGISANTLYVVANVTTNTFTLTTTSGSAVSFTSAGSNFQAGSANGYLINYNVFSSIQTVQPNVTFDITFDFADYNGAYGSGI